MASITPTSAPTGAPLERHPVDEVLPPQLMVTYGLQHVLSMAAGVIAVPLILAGVLKLSPADTGYVVTSTLFICGLATLLQTLGVWKIGVKLPIVQGVSFAPVATMIAIGAVHGHITGLRTIYGAVIIAGVVGLVLSPIFSRLLRFFPPVVTGSVITIIGLSLLPVATQWCAGGVGASNFGSEKNIAFAAATLLLILLIYRFLPGFFSRAAILLGLIVMILIAIPFGLDNFTQVTKSSVVHVPGPFHFGSPIFLVGSILSMILAMLVIMTETTADILAIGEVVDRPQGVPGVGRGLAADCTSTAVAGVWNTFPCTAFAQNVGLVAVTGIKSRFVVAVAGAILLIGGVIPPVGAAVASIPLPVLGGAGLVLFGTVAASGIRTLARVEYEGTANLIIVAVTIAVGLIPVGVPDFYAHFPSGVRTVLDSGISAGAVVAVLLNLLFNVRRARPEILASTSAPRDELLVAPAERRVTLDEVNQLDREAFVAKLGPIFQGPVWAVERAYARQPFASMIELRWALQDELFGASPEEQLELVRAYPRLGQLAQPDQRAAEMGISREDLDDLMAVSGLRPESLHDQSSAGLDRLSPEEFERFTALNDSYEQRFGFPLIVAVRAPGHTKETILQSGVARLDNSPVQERATALVEIAKIANLRLSDVVAEPAEPAQAVVA
ncbi:MAG: 2-oxo-4-hydroxy-4-carboxy-5-ureidoimidazoline decarboxylase [Solirubrobacterales bacterium]|nr:2-oxo-4-hydroxy-4-carboxy-5-ureidoimidazoline decarboxylase [Solirubrobacterales bacterium]